MDRKINFRRWCDVMLLGLVSYALMYLIASVGAVQVAFGKWASLFSSLHMAVQILLALTGFYCARHLLLFFNVIHKRQLKNIGLHLSYPPITFSIVLCFLLFLPQFDMVNFFSETLFASYFLVAALLFVTLLSLLCVFDSLYSERRNDTQEHVLVPEWITDEEHQNHYRWLMSERSLDECDKDMLGREIYVDRIARLFAPIDGKLKGQANQIAIIGPFGIGKTSLWKRVEPKLGDDFIFVSVDGWGRGEGTVAAQIIDEMVAALSAYVDCASIRNIPNEYMAALSGADFKGVSALAKILPLHSHQSPEELIGKIEAILFSINKTMVVVLEDFDRNPQGEIIMNEIAGLLDRLRDLRSISFIVCLAPGVKSHILSRISTHREDLLAFNASEFVGVTIELMKVYAGSKNRFIFPTHEEQTQTFIRAINSVIKTPREAKYALRRTFTAWLTLVGEVNLYDLLAANVLRYSTPKSFDLIVENFEHLKAGVTDAEKYTIDDTDKKTQHREVQPYINAQLSKPTDAAVKQLIETLLDEGLGECEARCAIQMLIPTWHSVDGRSKRDVMQRVSGWQGDIYLKRIVAEQIDREHENESDDEFFKGIFAESLADDKEFMKKLVESENWVVKFIELTVNCCNAHFELETIAKKFTKFLAAYCKLKKILLFGDPLSRFNNKTIGWIIKSLSADTTINVFRGYIDGMHSDPEALFNSLEKCKKYFEGDCREQYELWIENRDLLQKILSESTILSAEVRSKAYELLSEMNN